MRQRLVTKRRSADKAKFSADKAKFSADKAKLSADKAKFSADKAKFSADKAKFSADKVKYSVDKTKFSMDKTKFSFDKAKFAVDMTKFTKFSADKSKPSCGRRRPTTSAELLRIFRRTLVSTLPANHNFNEGLCSSMPNIKVLSEAPKKRSLFRVRFQMFQSQLAEERRSASMPTLSFRRAIKMKTCGCVCRMFCRRRELHKARSEELKKKANGAV